jgi:hypothetical protein
MASTAPCVNSVKGAVNGAKYTRGMLARLTTLLMLVSPGVFAEASAPAPVPANVPGVVYAPAVPETLVDLPALT